LSDYFTKKLYSFKKTLHNCKCLISMYFVNSTKHLCNFSLPHALKTKIIIKEFEIIKVE